MSWLDGLRERLVDRLHGERRDRELAEEIRVHLEMETERQLLRGRDPVTARSTALARFGNPARIADDARAERGPNHVEGTMQDVLWSFRTLGKHPAFTALALITLALGIGVTTVGFSVLDTVLLRPLPFRDSNRLVFVTEMMENNETRPPSFLNFVDWRAQSHEFSGVASEMYPYSMTLMVGVEPVRAPFMGISRDFFRVLGAPPAVGREFTANENSVGGPFALMVSYDFWKNQLGGRMPLGSVHFHEADTPIVGVVKQGFRLVGDADVFFPHEQWPGTVRSSHNYVVVGRLAPRATFAAAKAEMSSLTRALRATYGDDTGYSDISMLPLRDYLVARFRVILTIVFAAAGLVLLIACTNLVSAQLARGLGREREVAVRIALGASRGRLMRQLLVESGVLAVGGAALGVVVAAVLSRLVRTLGAGSIHRLSELTLDGRVIAFACGLTVLTSLLIGLYPAFRLSERAPGAAMGAGSRDVSATSRSGAWPVLVGFEIAVAMMLLVGSALLIRTMHNILTSDVGFDPRGVITAGLSPDSLPPGEAARLTRELIAIPGVTGAAFITRYPLLWGNESSPVLRPSDAPNKWPALAGFRVVSAGYFEVMRQPILRGRAFTSGDVVGNMPAAIITPGIANTLWPGQNPVGKSIRTNHLSTQWLTVVGVVAEASSWSEARGSQNEIYVALAQQPSQWSNLFVAVVRTNRNMQAMVPVVRDRLRAALPLVPAKMGTIEEQIAATAADRRFATIALGVFALVALMLAGVGIYGVMSYAVVARRHEIGVRMALGATPSGIQLHVLGEAAAMSAGGLIVGIVGAVAGSRYLESVLYGVTRLDPVVYVAGISFLMVTALAGAYVPARRSSRVDPLTAIRGD